MCFRPADASAGAGPNKCPECGKTIQMMGGIVLKSCPFCKADFSKYMNADGTPKAAPGAPRGPGCSRRAERSGCPRRPQGSWRVSRLNPS